MGVAWQFLCHINTETRHSTAACPSHTAQPLPMLVVCRQQSVTYQKTCWTDSRRLILMGQCGNRRCQYAMP